MNEERIQLMEETIAYLQWDGSELVYEILANKHCIRIESVSIPSISSVVFPDRRTAKKALEISGVRGLV